MREVHEHVAHHRLRLSVWLADADGRAPDALQAPRERSVDGLIYTAAVDHLPKLKADINAGVPIVLMGLTIRRIATDTVAGANVKVGSTVDVSHGSETAHSAPGGIEQGFRKRHVSLSLQSTKVAHFWRPLLRFR